MIIRKYIVILYLRTIFFQVHDDLCSFLYGDRCYAVRCVNTPSVFCEFSV